MYVNRKNHWQFQWEQIRAGEVEAIESVSCIELVNGWDIKQAEKEAIFGELDYPEAAICPNITDFDIWKGNEYEQYDLQLGILAIEDDEKMIENSIVMTSDITRNFNAEDFLDNGF